MSNDRAFRNAQAAYDRAEPPMTRGESVDDYADFLMHDARHSSARARQIAEKLLDRDDAFDKLQPILELALSQQSDYDGTAAQVLSKLRHVLEIAARDIAEESVNDLAEVDA